METMSVTRGLAELKRINDRITKATNEGVFVAVAVGKNTSVKVHDSQLTKSAMTSKIQESFDKVLGLLQKREKIKAAIVKSNAVTVVKFLGREVTVAEAIEMKNSVSTKKSLLSVLKLQYTRSNNFVSSLNAKLDETIESNLKTIYGSEKSKIDQSVYESVAKPQKEQKEASLLDPKSIAERIEELEEEISVIETELDFTLSESNSRTEIQV